jgi:hypothetical protein
MDSVPLDTPFVQNYYYLGGNEGGVHRPHGSAAGVCRHHFPCGRQASQGTYGNTRIRF